MRKVVLFLAIFTFCFTSCSKLARVNVTTNNAKFTTTELTTTKPTTTELTTTKPTTTTKEGSTTKKNNNSMNKQIMLDFYEKESLTFSKTASKIYSIEKELYIRNENGKVKAYYSDGTVLNSELIPENEIQKLQNELVVGNGLYIEQSTILGKKVLSFNSYDSGTGMMYILAYSNSDLADLQYERIDKNWFFTIQGMV